MSRSDAQITQIRERLQKVSDSGDWQVVDGAADDEYGVSHRGHSNPSIAQMVWRWDAEFIAHAPADVRDLLALVDQLRQQNREAEACVTSLAREAKQLEDDRDYNAGLVEQERAACARLRTALEPVFKAWHGLGVVVVNPTVLAELEAALALPDDGAESRRDHKAESSQR